MTSITQSDLRKVSASMKSYIGASILVFVLYGFAWLPGFIANIIYWNEAKKMERMAGQHLSGTGCLGLMMICNILAIISLIMIFCVAPAILGTIPQN